MGLPDVDDGDGGKGRRLKDGPPPATALPATAIIATPVATIASSVAAPRADASASAGDGWLSAQDCDLNTDPSCNTNTPGQGVAVDRCANLYIALYNDTQQLHADQFALQLAMQDMDFYGCWPNDNLTTPNPLLCMGPAATELTELWYVQLDNTYLNADVYAIQSAGC